MEAWLEAYHYTSSGSKAVDFGQLDARAGAIQVYKTFLLHKKVANRFTMFG